METVRILSCVPVQQSKELDKLAWIDRAVKEHRPDILVTPQEFFGGAVMMPHRKSFYFRELYPHLQKLSKKYGCALVVGVLEKFGEDAPNREVIWFINEHGEYMGKVTKFALPRYDHISTNGYGEVEPETDLLNRFITFPMKGLNVTGMFCWEVYSDLLWTGIGVCEPDVVFSLIKFGVNSWPVVRKLHGSSEVVDFGYGTWNEDGRWIERLRIANVWQCKCPIICSTNSWNLRPISMPLCGCISGIPGQATDSLWHPTKSDKLKTIPEVIQVDIIDPKAVRGSKMNKFVYKDMTGEFPPFDLGHFTMMLKIKRIEDRLLSGKEQQGVLKARARKKRSKGGFNL